MTKVVASNFTMTECFILACTLRMTNDLYVVVYCLPFYQILTESDSTTVVLQEADIAKLSEAPEIKWVLIGRVPAARV